MRSERGGLFMKEEREGMLASVLLALPGLPRFCRRGRFRFSAADADAGHCDLYWSRHAGKSLAPYIFELI